MLSSDMPRPRSLRSISITKDGGTRPGPTSAVSTTSTRPASPAFTDTTNASQMNFGVEGPDRIITRADLKHSSQAYENLIAASESYREALMHMSRATSAFADAMEGCASLKGASYSTGSRFQAASGLHHLMGNHWHVLSDTVDKKFERPLRQHLDVYRAVVAERSQAYERVLREKSHIIRKTEKENMNVSRKKHRNLQSFREALAILQRQVEELDELRLEHYQDVLNHEEEVWDSVQGKVSVVMRSTLDVIDRIATKATDPSIESMLQSVPDPFDAYGPPKPENQIFSILTPLAIFNGPDNSSSATLAVTDTAIAEGHNTDDFAVGIGASNSHSRHSWEHAFDEQGMEHSGASGWSNGKTPTSSPPPSIRGVASSSSSATTVHRSKSPPSTSTPRRGSFPTGISSASGSGISLSTDAGSGTAGVQSQQRLRSEAKLRNMLSVISEKSSHSQASSHTSSRSQSSSHLSGHDRESSHDTLRARDLPRNLLESIDDQANDVNGDDKVVGTEKDGLGLASTQVQGSHPRNDIAVPTG